ncbi:MAG: fibronectin type III domain-containing protein [Elusimicrobia bacterium]|nr:fibronectin type III domain-containing protein [Elusimicrobiota bacterium]
MKGKALLPWSLAALLLSLSSPLCAQILFRDFQIQGCQGSPAVPPFSYAPSNTVDGSGNVIIHTSNPSFSLSITTLTSSASGLLGNTCGGAAYAVPSATVLTGVQDLWKFDSNGTDSAPSARTIAFAGRKAGDVVCSAGQTYVNAKNVPQTPVGFADLAQAWQPSNLGTVACPLQFGNPGGTNIDFKSMSSFTVEVWVKWTGKACDIEGGAATCPGTLAGQHDWPILIQCDTTAADRCLHLTIRPGSPGCNTPAQASGPATPYFGFFGDDVCGGDVSDGNFHHLAFVFDGATNNKFVYKDGALVSGGSSGTAAKYNGTATATFIGGLPTGQPFNDNSFAFGAIDSLRIFNQNLTQGTIAAHALGGWFSIAGDTKFDGNLSGQYCNAADVDKTPIINSTWTFNSSKNVIPSGSGADTNVNFTFTDSDTNEFIGQGAAIVNDRQSTMTIPPQPGMTFPAFDETDISWAIPTWFCDTANTTYTFNLFNCQNGNCSTTFGTTNTSQTSKTFNATGLNTNTRYALTVNATYIDTGGNGSTVGPSAPTPSTAVATLAWPPDPPINVVSLGATAASMTLVLTQFGDVPLNPTYTAQKVEQSNDNGITFIQGSGYLAFNAAFSQPRLLNGLQKSSKYIFRARNENLDGRQTTPTPLAGGVPAAGLVTQPSTPQSFNGSSAQGIVSCPKTDIKWTWDQVTSGSDQPPGGSPISSTRYLVTDNGGTPISPGTMPACLGGGGCISTTFFINTPLASGTVFNAKVFAFDPGAPGVPAPGVNNVDLRFSDPSQTAFTATAVAGNTAPTGVAGVSLAGGIQWSWTAPLNLCNPHQYTVFDAAAAVGTLAGPSPNPNPFNDTGLNVTWQQSPLGPNAEAAISVQALDTIGGAGPLSLSATQYTQAFAPTNLTFVGVSTGAIVLNWNANGNPGYTRYEVTQSPDNFTVVITTPVRIFDNHKTTSAGITGLLTGTTYYFRVRAFNGQASDGSGTTFTPFVSGSVMTLFSPPAVSATALSASSIDWQWPSVANVSSYQVYRTPPGSLQATLLPPYSGVLGSCPPGGTCHYTPGGLATNTQYGVQVLALNGQGLASASPLVSVYTFAVAPTVPANDIVGVTTNSITYQWTAGSNPPGTFYEIDVATNSSFVSVLTTATPSSPGVTIAGLFPLTTYFAEIRAFNGDLIAVPGYVVLDSTRTDGDSQVSQSSAPATVYQVPTGAVAQFHFDESSGTAASDSSGYGNTAALTCLANGCVSTPTWTSGPYGLRSAVSLSGLTSSFVRVPSAAQYDLASSLTLEAWVNPATLAEVNGAGILARGPFNGEGFFLDLFGGKYRFSGCPSGSGGAAVSASAFVTGQWTHVAGTYNSGTGANTIYVNGVADGAGVCGAHVAAAGTDVSIGNRRSGTLAYDLGFNGAVDELRLISGLYSAAQISQDYASSFASTVTLAGANARLQLLIPPNAFGGPATLYASADPINHPLKISVPELMLGLASPPTRQMLVPGMLVEIVPIVNGLQFTGPLGSSATIELTYTDADNDGLIDGVKPALAASTVRIYTLDTSVGQWIALPTTLDSANRRISAVTPHFSVFGGFGATTTGLTTTETRVYPVPWKIGSGGSFDALKLTFDTLPAEGSIRIFTLAGQKVVDLPFVPANAGKIFWDGLNFNGNAAASGVYFALIKTANGATRVLKFAIER